MRASRTSPNGWTIATTYADADADADACAESRQGNNSWLSACAGSGYIYSAYIYTLKENDDDGRRQIDSKAKQSKASSSDVSQCQCVSTWEEGRPLRPAVKGE